MQMLRSMLRWPCKRIGTTHQVSERGAEREGRRREQDRDEIYSSEIYTEERRSKREMRYIVRYIQRREGVRERRKTSRRI